MIQKTDFQNKAQLSYDPEDVNIRAQVFRLSAIMDMLERKALDIYDNDLDEVDFWDKKRFVEEGGEEYLEIDDTDDLQRNPALWNNVQKSRFIESLMIKIPIPAFYFDGSQKQWRVVDGLQRLHTLRSFIRNEFKLTSLEYLQETCGNCYYDSVLSSVPDYFRRRILDTEIIAYVINPGTPGNVKYNVFKRINTGGLQLNGQEIRNAFFAGRAAEFTKRLANLPVFKAVTNNKVSPRRMTDREFANRFIAFQIFDYKQYNGKMDFFLTEAMSNLSDRPNEDYDELEYHFGITMVRAFEILSEHAFYRPVRTDKQWGRQPNKALFDTLSWNLNELLDYEFAVIAKWRDEFVTRYRDFMIDNSEIHEAIKDTTSSKKAVITRIDKLRYFLKDFIQ